MVAVPNQRSSRARKKSVTVSVASSSTTPKPASSDNPPLPSKTKKKILQHQIKKRQDDAELLSFLHRTPDIYGNRTFEPRVQNSKSSEPQNPENQQARPNREIEEETDNKEWVININKMLNQAKLEDIAACWAKLSIYRFPKHLRNNAGDKKAYIPQTVSFGPYHHKDSGLQNMNRHKWRTLQRILDRTYKPIEFYLTNVKELEERVRDCYEGTISLSSNEFVEMMLLDSCFILELFRVNYEGFSTLGYSIEDPIFATPGAMHLIQRDMIMLENQIPFFLLEKVFALQDLEGSVATLAIAFFDTLTPKDKLLKSTTQTQTNHQSPGQTGLHCLEVFRRNFFGAPLGTEHQLPPKKRDGLNFLEIFRRNIFGRKSTGENRQQQQLVHSVIELKDAGITFKKRKTNRFWDIKFEKGVLEIPRLLIHDGTKSLLLNLIAYEQCHLACTNEITSYLAFMDNLIDSPEDVSYLHECGIIDNWLGSDAEVANLFNGLCKDVIFDMKNSYLTPLSVQMNEYYDHKWNAQIAMLKNKYFNGPWAIISFTAAAVLLGLTFLQTFYTVYAYYSPHS